MDKTFNLDCCYFYYFVGKTHKTKCKLLGDDGLYKNIAQ